MQTTILYGSPKKNSNSYYMGETFSEEFQKNGGEVKTFRLNSLKFKGCQACMLCKTKYDQCALKDDLTEVLEAISKSDILVLASGVYFGDVTAQLKGAIDRMYSFYHKEFWLKEIKSRLSSNKKLVFLLAQGNPEKAKFADISLRYSPLLEIHGFSESHAIRAVGVFEDGDILTKKNTIRDIKNLAKEILINN